MLDEIYKTEAELAADADHAAREDAFRRDLADVISTPSGFAVMAEILRRLGVESLSSDDIRAIALRNTGEQLLSEIQQVRPQRALRLIANLRNIIF